MLLMDIVPMAELFMSRYSSFRQLRHNASSISAASKCLTTIAVCALKKIHEASNKLPLYGLFFMQNGLNSCACIVQGF